MQVMCTLLVLTDIGLTVVLKCVVIIIVTNETQLLNYVWFYFCIVNGWFMWRDDDFCGLFAVDVSFSDYSI